MRQNANSDFQTLLADQQPPCISLYMPTHRQHPDKQQDPVRYRNLVRRLEGLIPAASRDDDMRKLRKRFEELVGDSMFWNHRTDGLVILGSQQTFRIFSLQRPVAELLVVADSFHIKPLLRIQQSADRFQILGINRHEVRLYEGNRDVLDEVELASAVPRTLDEALGEELTEPHLTVARYGGAGQGTAHGGPGMYHGHGARKDEVDLDNERFFRVIDRAVLEHHSQPSGLPLILASLPEHHDLFHSVSHNRFLLAESIPADPASISSERLREEAWRILLPRYQERLRKLVDDYRIAHAANRAAADLTDIAQALIAGRVGWLLVESELQIPGRIDRESGHVRFGNSEDTEGDDLLDDLAELTLAMGGEVIVVPADQMPTNTGAAATFRF